MVSSSGLSCKSSPRISAPICWGNGTTSSRALVIATIGGVEAEKTAGELQNDGVLPSRRYARRAVPGGSQEGDRGLAKRFSAGGARRRHRAAFWSGPSHATASLLRASRGAGSSPRGVGDRSRFRRLPLRV